MDQFAVWNRIGASFSPTRSTAWPLVTAWLEGRPPGRLLDLMGGNGRHGAVARALGHDVVVADWSAPLVGDSCVPAVQADARCLPFGDGTFANALYVAGVHGLPAAADRARSLHELHRTLQPGGRCLVTAWSARAPRFAGATKRDIIVPWRRDGLDAPRTIHLYDVGDMQEELEAAGFLVISSRLAAFTGADPDNVVAEAVR